jgi:predicted RNA methylase
MLTPNGTVDLQARIGKIYDHMYANSPVRTPDGISREVGKLLHAVMWHEESTGQRPAFVFSSRELKNLESEQSFFTSGIPHQFRSWYVEMNKRWRIYEPDSTIILSDSDLRFCAAQLNGIIVSDRNRDVIGDALEIFRSSWSKQVGGQFFTDQRVTRLAMDILEFSPENGDDLVDICAGTAGFLLAGLNHIRARVTDESEIVAIAQKSLLGQEVDESVAAIANSTLNARLGDRVSTLVATGDSLNELSGNLRLDSHRCVATNPPFGTKITIKDPAILRNYDLASLNSRGRSTRTVSPKPPDILFLERNIRLLKPGEGRLAIVLPYQILSGPQTTYVRRWLLAQAHILAVIDLPAVTFQPHTGTKTSLLVVKRRNEPLDDISEMEKELIFFSIPKWIGHDRRGNPVYERDIEGNITASILSDMEVVADAWESYRLGGDPGEVHDSSWIGSSDDIVGDPLLRLNALYNLPGCADVPAIPRTGVVRLGDVVDRIFYPGRFKRYYVSQSPEAIPFLGGASISQLLLTTSKWIAANSPHAEDLRVREGWILVTRSGSTGIISSVPKAWDGFAISEHVIRIVPNEAKLPSGYLQAYLRSLEGQAQLTRGVFGSVIDEISPEYIAGLQIPVPSPELLDSISLEMNRAEELRQDSIARFETALQLLESGSL